MLGRCEASMHHRSGCKKYCVVVKGWKSADVKIQLQLGFVLVL
jgi:hypothetical protein